MGIGERSMDADTDSEIHLGKHTRSMNLESTSMERVDVFVWLRSDSNVAYVELLARGVCDGVGCHKSVTRSHGSGREWDGARSPE